MQRIKFILGPIAILIASLAIYFVLQSEHALVAQPKGAIAHGELKLIKMNIHLMLLIVVPTLILFYLIAWKYRAKNPKAKYDPDYTSKGVFGEGVLWVIPVFILAPMAVITWFATHKLDPYQPIESETKTLEIQVVAMDWKWLFIYPEEEIATVNFVQIPERTPVHFSLAADGSPMNSFWIPELCGQIYAMSGMITPLHVMADGPGVYAGRAAEINGVGFSDMTFIVKSTTRADFDDWVADVKESPLQLTDPVYNQLVKPSMKNPVALYSYVEPGLFDKIVMKYMEAGTPASMHPERR